MPVTVIASEPEPLRLYGADPSGGQPTRRGSVRLGSLTVTVTHWQADRGPPSLPLGRGLALAGSGLRDSRGGRRRGNADSESRARLPGQTGPSPAVARA